jgi:hypothetical protein
MRNCYDSGGNGERDVCDCSWGAWQRDVIAHVGGVAVEEVLLPLESGLPAGRRTRLQ